MSADKAEKGSREAAVQFVQHLFRRHPFKTTFVVGSMSLVGLLEGVGIALLIPLLTVMGLGGEGASAGRLATTLSNMFAAVGLQLNLLTVLALFVLVVTAENAIRFMQRKYARTFLADFGLDMRASLYEAYLRARWPFWMASHVGHMINRLTLEGTRVEAAFHYLMLLLADLAFVIVFLVLAFTLSWQLAAFFIVAGGLMFAALRGRFRAAGLRGSFVSRRSNELQEVIQEHFGAAKFIKTSGTEARSLTSVRGLMRELADAELAANVHTYFVGALLQPAMGLVLAIGLYVGLGYLKVEPARILVMLLVFYRMAPKIATVQQMAGSLQLVAPAFLNMRQDLLHARGEQEQRAGSLPVARQLETGVVFQDVTFAYPGREPIFSRLNLEIPARQTTALVGGSGAGKSTLIDLLMRLLEPQSGAVLVDGTPIRDLDLREWRRRVGYVAQETVLFHDTIRNNIAWAKPDATDEEIEAAARLAHAHDFIVKTPDGYNTVVGHRGSRLSGGERQRIALARVLITEPMLLILDEATSNLDADSERHVQDAIEDLRDRMTIVMVAHRLSTLRGADLIYVLEQGVVAERGTWDTLLATDSRFASLWALQSRAER